jgi:hypothetical protein
MLPEIKYLLERGKDSSPSEADLHMARLNLGPGYHELRRDTETGLQLDAN